MKYLMIFFFALFTTILAAQNQENAILGKWESTEKNLIVDVYKQGDSYRAKVDWFYDEDDTITPINQRLDIKNPNKDLRSRKILGMNVLSDLIYNPKQKRWVNGKIYDSSSGKTWSSTVWLTDASTLNVRGYYIFRFFGKTLVFKRVR